MALDEPKENDDIHEFDGVKYLVDKEFMEKAKPIKVDFQGMGFKITSSIEFEKSSACSSCSTASDSCG